MFEDATFDARGAVRNHAPRWMMLTAAVNAVVVAGLILAPLCVPRTLPAFISEIKVPMYAPRSEPAPTQARAGRVASTQSVMLALVHNLPTIIDTRPYDPGPEPGSLVDIIGFQTSVPGGTPDGIAAFHGTAPHVVTQQVPQVARVSGGVATGLLLEHAAPIYPVIAKSAHVEGDVVLAATISEQGKVDNLRVISGNPMLCGAAVEAVLGWRYRPYLLSGKPVEVETTITVRFSLQAR